MTQLYTPWMTQAGQTIGSAIAQQGQNRMYSDAYMGKPGAVERLMQINPGMAQQLIQQKQQAEQLKLQESAQLEERRKKILTEKRSIIENHSKNIAKFGTFEEANKYFQDEKARLQETDPELAMAIGDGDLTPEHFNQLKAIYGEKPEKPEKLDNFQGLIKSWKEAPEGSEEKRLLEAKIGKEVAQAGGMRISYDAEGRPVIETGGASGTIEKKTQGTVEADLLTQADHLAKLENITREFDQDYQTLGKKVEAFMTGGKSFLGFEVSPEDEQAYSKMTEQRANIGELTSTIRNDLFGAALTEAERKSANVFLPNVESDNPIELKRKTERMLKTAKRAVARLNYIRKNGFELNEIGLQEIDNVMAKRAKDLHDEIKAQNPNASEDAVRNQVLQSVRREFGLVQ